MVRWLRTSSVLAVRILLCVLTLATLPLFAQQSTTVTGGLNGTVVDSTAAVVGDATITLAGPQGTRVVKSDGAGHYSISGLIPGFYDATVEKTGFKKVKSVHNEVTVGGSSLLNFTLPVGNAEETVEVTATAVGIDTESTAIDANLTDTFYNSIPMPRQVSAIFYAAPGVAGGQVAAAANATGPGSSNPSIGGSTGLENLYVVDGVTITDQAYGSLGTYNVNHGSLGTGINLAFIKEVDVKSYGFEPQYGKAQGGIVQMVTKSGSNTYHGALAAYVGPGSWYADRNQFYEYGYIQTYPSATLSSPHYDLAAEFGGYVPHFRDKIFFFGAFNPSLDQNINEANPTFPFAPIVNHGAFAYSTTAMSWAGKLTFQISPKLQFEVASFGDPSRHNSIPNTLSTTNILSSLSSYQYGSRDSLARLNAVITPTWLADASFTYNYDHFNETPALNQYSISDQSLQVSGAGGTVATGFGSFAPTKEDTYTLTVNTQKTAHLFGEHTFSVGYSYDHTGFLYQPSRSGSLFAIPDANAAGVALNSLFTTIPARTVGAKTNGQYTVTAINSKDLTDTTCTQCPLWNGMHVYASQTRGTYVGLSVNSLGRYHASYGNDTWVVNRFLTFNGGVRWEEQRVGGSVLKYPFTGNWSPRVGVNIDPFGDRKGKVFFNFGRNYWAMPLDAANRQLGNEQDDTSYYFAPEVVNGALVIVPDDAHNLNGLPKSTTAGVVAKFGAPSFASSTGEGIIPGTKSEYEDEYVLGIEREIKSGLVLKARWVDRRLGRIIEDIGSQSPEAATISGNYNGGIANPGPGTDIAVNEDEVTYTADQFAAANPALASDGSNYVAPVAGCTADNDTYFSAGGIWVDGKNNPIGGGCFTNLADMDAGPGDGKPDGFVKPVRRYQALEVEFDKRFSNHWLAVVNYRYANLWGNYEGAYRNDNGQSDPGISSLFDFTAGRLNLLGDQFRPGWLSTDRRSVGNMFLSYTVGGDSPFVGRFAKGLTTGVAFRGQSGVPLSLLGDHPIYDNQGEVPIGGRGAAGRTPAAVQMDLKGEYALHVHESKVLKLALDAFNVTNSQYQTGRVQFTQQPALGPPVVGSTPNLNKDYGRPTSFQGPFYARATIRFEF
ncbi:MAG TPA: carboxypeptidase regulatory-like domain-containing protein [Terracidiphilus sp.]|nr:carboxypeptidase regulatory-like domain-containing protein [Terracidiphilus sp.]